MTLRKLLLGKLIRFKSDHRIYGFITDVGPDFSRKTGNMVPNKLVAKNRSGSDGWELLHEFNSGLEFHDGNRWTDIPEMYYYVTITI